MSAAPKKIDPKDIVAEVQSLYGKDKKGSGLLSTGSQMRRGFKPEDCIALPEGHVLREITGLPGLPYNKLIQLAGRPDSGKSTIGSEMMVAAQQAGAWVILLDSEAKFDADRFALMGGDPSSILTVRTNEILKGGAAVARYIKVLKEKDPAAKILFVWDSVGGSQSRSHSERQLDAETHAQPGQDAKENSSLMKVIVGLINAYPDSIVVYLVNQVYAKIGFMQKGDAIPGGSKIEFHSSLIIMLRRIKTLVKTQNKMKVKFGIISRATVVKNHLSQGLTSVHSLDFQITAGGTQVSYSESGADIDAEE